MTSNAKYGTPLLLFVRFLKGDPLAQNQIELLGAFGLVTQRNDGNLEPTASGFAQLAEQGTIFVLKNRTVVGPVADEVLRIWPEE